MSTFYKFSTLSCFLTIFCAHQSRLGRIEDIHAWRRTSRPKDSSAIDDQQVLHGDAGVTDGDGGDDREEARSWLWIILRIKRRGAGEAHRRKDNEIMSLLAADLYMIPWIR